MGKTRDDWRKAIRIVCITRHAKTCTVLENCNGNYCNNPQCHRSGEEAELVIDEIDNNRHNHDPDNQQLLCHSCNQKKSPKHLRSKRNTGSVGVRDNLAGAGRGGVTLTELDMVDEEVRRDAQESNPQIDLSEQMKHAYRRWLAENVNREGGVTVSEAINEAGFVLDINPVTLRRYLGMLVSGPAPYKKEKSMRKDADGKVRAYTFIKAKESEAVTWTKDDEAKLQASIEARKKATVPAKQDPQREPVAPLPTAASLPPLTKGNRPSYIQ